MVKEIHPSNFFLFIAAYLNINACPIEGLKKDKVKTVLANTHHLYDSEHFGVACMTALGYRGVTDYQCLTTRGENRA